jgi:hypothetical protein
MPINAQTMGKLIGVDINERSREMCFMVLCRNVCCKTFLFIFLMVARRILWLCEI